MAALRRIGCLLLDAESPPAEAQRALLDVASAHSPRVEEAGPGLCYLALDGLEGLFGGEAEIGRRLFAAAAARGLRVRVGAASSRLGALAAAHRARGVAVVAPEDEAALLARAPLALLDLPEELRTRLEGWGVRTLGELAALPARGLHERLGAEGPRLKRMARGEDRRPLRPPVPPPVFEESSECDWAMDTLEPITRLLGVLAGRICEQLTRRGLSADRFEWSCRLADRGVHEGEWVPASPMNEAELVVPLLAASFASRPPRSAVEGLRLRARPTRVSPAQGSFTDPLRSSPRLLHATLARLAELVGPGQIGIPVLLDSHRPDAVALEPFSLSPHPGPRPGRARGAGPRSSGAGEPSSLSSAEREGQEVAAGGTGRGPVLALRRLRPPRPAQVRLIAGRPVHLRSGWLAGSIVAGAGPWRTSGEWWTEARWAHDEWDVELGNGTLCRLCHDGSGWFLEGVYD